MTERALSIFPSRLLWWGAYGRPRRVTRLGGGHGLRRVGWAEPAAHDRPAIDPVEPIEERWALGDVGFRKVRIIPFHRMIETNWTVEMGEDGVMPRADPPVAVRAQNGCSAHLLCQQRNSFAVGVRAEDAGGASDEHTIAGDRAVAALARRGEQIVEAAVPDDRDTFVPVHGSDRHFRRRVGRQAIRRETARRDTADEAAVKEIALPINISHDGGVVHPTPEAYAVGGGLRLHRPGRRYPSTGRSGSRWWRRRSHSLGREVCVPLVV